MNDFYKYLKFASQGFTLLENIRSDFPSKLVLQVKERIETITGKICVSPNKISFIKPTMKAIMKKAIQI